jgi:cytochrome c-type biogenesis protein
MRYVDLIAAAFLVLSGLYLLYYFAVVDVGGDTSSITDSVQRFQTRVSTTLAGRWELIAVVLVAVVVAALVFVTRRPSPPQPTPGRAERA